MHFCHFYPTQKNDNDYDLRTSSCEVDDDDLLSSSFVEFVYFLVSCFYDGRVLDVHMYMMMYCRYDEGRNVLHTIQQCRGIFCIIISNPLYKIGTFSIFVI